MTGGATFSAPPLFDSQVWHNCRTMLLPKLTIRGILASMIGFGILFLVLADAVQGRPWAVATSIALSTIIVLGLCFVCLFFFSQAVAAIRGVFGAGGVKSGSPFAASGPPPQVVPPEESPE